MYDSFADIKCLKTIVVKIIGPLGKITAVEPLCVITSCSALREQWYLSWDFPNTSAWLYKIELCALLPIALQCVFARLHRAFFA